MTLTDPNTNLSYHNISQSLNESNMINIKESSCGINLLNKLKPVTYQLSTDDTEKTYIGFTPKNIFLATTETNCSLNMVKYSEGSTSNINTNAFIAPIVKSIQELNNENIDIVKIIQNLKNEIKKLKCSVKKLKKQNKSKK